jgi:hypothetical protein
LCCWNCHRFIVGRIFLFDRLADHGSDVWGSCSWRKERAHTEVLSWCSGYWTFANESTERGDSSGGVNIKQRQKIGDTSERNEWGHLLIYNI